MNENETLLHIAFCWQCEPLRICQHHSSLGYSTMTRWHTVVPCRLSPPMRHGEVTTSSCRLRTSSVGRCSRSFPITTRWVPPLSASLREEEATALREKANWKGTQTSPSLKHSRLQYYLPSLLFKILQGAYCVLSFFISGMLFLADAWPLFC